MKKLLPLLLILTVLGWGCEPSERSKKGFQDKTTLNFNKDWQFARGIDTTVVADYFEKESSVEWENISLPHTAHIEPLVIEDQQWQGTAFYRKFFEVKSKNSDKRLAVKFGAAMHEADVYLNGEKLMKHKGGYLPFVVDITDKVQFDEENVLLVKLNNEDNPTIPPGKPIENLDFNYFSGLYRNVHLLIDDKLHISDPIAADRVAGGGLLVRTSDVSDKSAIVSLQTDILNSDDAPQQGLLKTTLCDQEGNVVAEGEISTEEIEAETYKKIKQEFTVKNPNLWSPDNPYLYTMTVELEKNREVVDSKREKIGIRTFHFNEGNQFVLNGEVLHLRGTNRHQSYPYIGYALSDNAQYRDAYKIKEAGFNFIRTAHYPPSPAFLDAADEIGLLFMNAIPGWQFFGDEEFQQLAYRDIRHMIRRDRNHPSIVLWEASLNESDMPEAFMDSAHAIVHDELPFTDTYSTGWMDYTYDVFIPARQHADPPEYWNDYSKDKPYFIAEYGDWEYYAHNAGFNQDEFEDLTEDARNSRQLRGDGQKRLAQQALNFQEAHNSNRKGDSFGDANWVMFDYNRGYADNLEASGIHDIFRVPKFAYYFYRSQAKPNLEPDARFNKPMIYVANFWSDSTFKTAKVYSNTEEVELFLNGESLGRKSPDSGRVSSHLQHPPFTFEIDEFEPGSLRAFGYIDGKKVAEHTQATPGEAKSIELDVDLSNKPLEAGQKDVVFVLCFFSG
ncbi:glycoside hydrolase family 2 protein [Aliifodinibius salipaludis]|uniref:glycoside hydrolase family 2 protein n=1 Tax=Fodinibius salipaludis TaxID=2032627 RepID=UPI001C3EDA50|nr:glycoside hydrolase family 2 TIM barrel-domain containing protein [Aliifodinibius salipaludis]